MRKVPKLIAEIGCNHKGDIKIAKEMIMVASQFCKAYAVKFQKRTPRELLTPDEYNSPHPNPLHSYGKTYGEHREFLEFNIKQHYELKKECARWNIVYGCSVWDFTSAKQIVSLKPGFIKIPSASNLCWDMIKFICKNYKGDIHVSLGMTKRDEERQIVQFFKEQKRLKDLILYHCTSGYPIAFEDICLLEINRLIKTYGKQVKSIGFSGHHLGIAADIAAITLGAEYIERHFTLDRTWKGTDHAASLEPDGLRRLARDINNVHKALTLKPKEILDIEVEQRKKLKRIK